MLEKAISYMELAAHPRCVCPGSWSWRSARTCRARRRPDPCEHGLYELARRFELVSATCRLPFKFEENRPFYQACFRYAMTLSRRGCHRCRRGGQGGVSLLCVANVPSSTRGPRFPHAGRRWRSARPC